MNLYAQIIMMNLGFFCQLIGFFSGFLVLNIYESILECNQNNEFSFCKD